MHGLGTLINALAIIAGGLLGIGCKRFLKEHYQETIMKATGFAVVFLGAAGTLSKMLVFTEAGTGLTTTGSMIMILSLTFGALIGEIIDIDGLFERFGEWLKHRTGSDGDNQFTNGFVAASLTVSIGAMAIIGSIQDGHLWRLFHTDSKSRTGFYHCTDHGIFHGKGMRLFLYSGCSLAGFYDSFGCAAVRLHDHAGT